MRINNLRYVSSYINRALNIGEWGYHSGPDYFKMEHLDEVTLDIMPIDEHELQSIYDMEISVEYKL